MKTKEEILKHHTEAAAGCKVQYNITHNGIIDAMQEFSDQQADSLRKELAKKHSQEPVDVNTLRERWEQLLLDHDVNTGLQDELFNFFLAHISKPKESEWVDVNERLPEEGQIVDVWQMPTTQRQGQIKNLENTNLTCLWEHTGFRSCGWMFKIDKDEDASIFVRVSEKTGKALSYPNNEEICIENGQVTKWMPLPPIPKTT
jgi:hypothetical protein